MNETRILGTPGDGWLCNRDNFCVQTGINQRITFLATNVTERLVGTHGSKPKTLELGPLFTHGLGSMFWAHIWFTELYVEKSARVNHSLVIERIITLLVVLMGCRILSTEVNAKIENTHTTSRALFQQGGRYKLRNSSICYKPEYVYNWRLTRLTDLFYSVCNRIVAQNRVDSSQREYLLAMWGIRKGALWRKKRLTQRRKAQFW